MKYPQVFRLDSNVTTVYALNTTSWSIISVLFGLFYCTINLFLEFVNKMMLVVNKQPLLMEENQWFRKKLHKWFGQLRWTKIPNAGSFVVLHWHLFLISCVLLTKAPCGSRLMVEVIENSHSSNHLGSTKRIWVIAHKRTLFSLKRPLDNCQSFPFPVDK